MTNDEKLRQQIESTLDHLRSLAERVRAANDGPYWEGAGDSADLYYARLMAVIREPRPENVAHTCSKCESVHLAPSAGEGAREK